MLSVNQNFGALASARIRERRFYVEIEPNPGTAADNFYIKSHSDIDLTSLPGTTIASKITRAKTSSQRLNPDEGRATIGTMEIQAADITDSLTDTMRTEYLTNSRGLRGKRVRLYAGFQQMSEVGITNYVLLDTQVVERTDYQIGGRWIIKCRDIQREARKKIFEPIVMNLAQPLDDTSTTIEVVNIPTAFDAVEHGTSYVDAPSSTVAYIKIDDEIIRVPTAGIGTTQFTSCVRGVLGTRAAAHTTDETAGSERGKKITEVAYLELPVPKMAYALLTGVLLGQTGTLPDHWHAGINASDFVKTSEFQNIGVDLYDTTDDTAGTIEKYIITEAVEAKAFIERQLYRKYGLFSPIHSDGEIGLKRGQPVLSGSATVGEINDSHIVNKSLRFKYDMTKVINDIIVEWNEVNGEPSRRLEIIDSDSVTAWGEAPPYTVLAKGLVGQRHTESTVRDLFEGLRDRYSGPPLIASVPVHASQMLYEVGDVVRLRTSFGKDFTNSVTSQVDRAVEIQGVTRDLIRGRVTYDVFGSTQRAGPLPPIESTAALADGFYTASGTDIATLGGVVDTGTELQLPDGLTLSGGADNSVTGAIWYATKDVRVVAGRTLNIDDNVQLRIRGVLQIDGTINGVGRGLAGVADTVDVSGIPFFGGTYTNEPYPFETQPGNVGYFGSTQGNGGLIERFRRRTGSSTRHRVNIQSLPCIITQGAVEAVPSYNLTVPSGGLSIVGLPTDLRGTSGGPGGVRHYNLTNAGTLVETNRGGTGGDGGAGLLIVSRGTIFGGSGKIDLSGDDGLAGNRNAAHDFPAWSGGGAGGAPGAVIFILDGASVSSPALTSGTIIADYGDSPGPGDPNNVLSSTWIEEQDTRIGPPTTSRAQVREDRASPDLSAASGREAGIAAARIFFLLPYVAPEEDTDDRDLAENQNITLGITEAFGNRLDENVTVLIATITEVSTTAGYSHANISVRGQSADAQFPDWVFVGGAEPTLEFELPADGETYDVRAVPVLINGVEAPSGTVQTQVLTDGSGLGPLLSGQNLIRDPNFLLTDQFGFGPYWTANGASIVIDATAGEDGGPVLQLGPSGGSNESVSVPIASAASPGDWFVARLRIFFSSDYNGTSFRFELIEEDDTGASVSSWPDLITDNDVVLNSWQTLVGSAQVANANTRQVRAQFTIASNHTVGEILVANVEWWAGAQSGSSIIDEDGNIVDDLALRNDRVAERQFGAINANASFQLTRRRQDGLRGGAPASWFAYASGGNVRFVDITDPDVVQFTTNLALNLVNAAWPVNNDTDYIIRIMARKTEVGDVSRLEVNVHEYDSNLPTGVAVIATHSGAAADDSSLFVAPTRVITLDRESPSYASADEWDLSTTFAIYEGRYRPSASALFASINIDVTNNGAATGNVEAEWCILSQESVRPRTPGDLGGLITNSWMSEPNYDSPVIRPLGWFLENTTDDAYLSYQDEAQTIMKLGVQSGADTSCAVCSTAFQVNANQVYRLTIRLRGRVADADGLYIRINERDSALPEGALFVERTNTGHPTYESNYDATATREITTFSPGFTRVSGGVDFEDDPVPSAWTEYVADYQPTNTATWASIAILNWVGFNDELWIDRVTLEPNPGDLSPLDQVDQSDVVTGALGRISQATGSTIVQIEDTSWDTVETVDITLPTDVTDTEVLIDFDTNLDWLEPDGSPPEGLTTVIQIRLLDDDSVVVHTMSHRLYAFILDSGAMIAEKVGSRHIHFSYAVPSANLNSGQVNTFTIQMRELSAVFADIEADDYVLRAQAVHQVLTG